MEILKTCNSCGTTTGEMTLRMTRIGCAYFCEKCEADHFGFIFLLHRLEEASLLDE